MAQRDVPRTRYQQGDRVRVRTGSPPGHFRTPAYIQGKAGRVAGVHGRFRNPESLARGDSGLPEQPLYQVEFGQAQVWEKYQGLPSDKLLIDIYEHWLDPA